MAPSACTCPVPRPNDPDENNRQSTNYCQSCGRFISPEWTSNDRTVRTFFDRIEAAIPSEPSNPTEEWLAFRAFRLMAEAREFAGRDTFGHRSLNRDNCLDAGEEAGDFAVYMHLHVLRKIREGGADEDIDSALMAAWHAFHAWRFAMEERHKGPRTSRLSPTGTPAWPLR